MVAEMLSIVISARPLLAARGMSIEYTGEPDADKILALWRSMGSPVVDRKAPGYIAPEFPSDFVWHVYVYAKGGAE